MIGKHFIMPMVITRSAVDGEIYQGRELVTYKRNLFFARPTDLAGKPLDDGVPELLVYADMIPPDELFDARPSTKNITVK